MASHVRGDLRAATPVLALPGPRFLHGPASSPGSPLATSPYLAWPPTSILTSGGPPWLLGTLPSPPSLELPRGGYGFSETPPGALSLVFTQGKGCMWQKQLYKCGCGGKSSRVTWRVC